jgi:hypothetical protein
MKNLHLKPKVGGLNPTRTVLLKAIKLSTAVNLQTPAIEYFTLYDKWVKCEGKRSALLRAKQIHHACTCYFFEQDSPKYPFLKTTAGFPTAVLKLRKLKSSPEGIQAALTLTGHYRGIKAPGAPDTSPIKEKGSGVPEKLLSDLMSIIPQKWKFDLDSLPQIHHEFRTRMGPNGQSLLNCLLDLISLKNDSSLLSHLHQYMSFFDTEVEDDLLELEEEDLKTPKATLTHSRLSVKQEFGGKDRIFAMCDYWTQISLHPLHDRLASILRGIRKDATFGQDLAAAKIKEWTLNTSVELFSLDLTSATDRFPLIVLSTMIGVLTDDDEFGESWSNLIADRSFTFQKCKVKWAVGQPLGAYSSWPSFALAHHLVVMLSAKRAGIVKPKYRILGDDIVIAEKPLATHYMSIMKELGVKFSLIKSISGKSRAEFAKRLFLKGNEVTPLPIKLLNESMSNYLLTKTFYETLARKTAILATLPPTFDFLKIYEGIYSSQTLKKVELLVTFPNKENHSKDLDPQSLWTRVVYPSGYDLADKEIRRAPFEQDLTLAEIESVHFFIRYKHIRDSYSREMTKTSSFEKILDSLELPGIGSGVDRTLHPVYQTLKILKDSQRKAHKALGAFWTKATKEGSAAMIPSVNLPNAEVFQPKHKAEKLQEARIILLTYTALLKYCAWKQDNQTQNVAQWMATL